MCPSPVSFNPMTIGISKGESIINAMQDESISKNLFIEVYMGFILRCFLKFDFSKQH